MHARRGCVLEKDYISLKASITKKKDSEKNSHEQENLDSNYGPTSTIDDDNFIGKVHNKRS